jgi:tetratricopeptide (TPR) repeat protein
MFAAAKRDAQVQDLIRRLDERAQPVSRAYARIIEGEAALQKGRHAEAITAYTAAIKEADLWLARFGLGVAYVAAERYVEGWDELKRCADRPGEATALFFDDIPTYRYASVLPYWLGRAQEGRGSADAAASFERFIAIRGAAATDPLVVDARQRLDRLRGAPSSR